MIIQKGNNRTKLLPIVLVFVFLVGLILGGSCFIPYIMARNTMPVDGVLTITEQRDGSLLLTWPVADRADHYLVEIFHEDDDSQALWSSQADSDGVILPVLPGEDTYTLQVHSAVEYKVLGQKKIRIGDASLEATTVLRAPRIVEFQRETDTENKIVSIDFEMLDADFAVFSQMLEGGTKRELQRFSGSDRIDLQFGENGDFQIPENGEGYELVMNIFRKEESLEFYGAADIRVSIDREDLLGRDLNLTMTDEGDNMISLRWDETKGEYYQVQRSMYYSGWDTVLEVAPGGERVYTSEHLEPFEVYNYRVVAVGGQTMADSPYAAISQEISFHTREDVIYATIWPVKDLEIYNTPDGQEAIDTAPVGKAFCVLEEINGYFQIISDGQIGYIDSNYCLINLPDYLGNRCSYDIANSYSAIYLVHGFEIPDVTGVVTKGYENICLADGSFVVPLLYPTAKKLLTACEIAEQQGYVLKIYDAFRPNVATNEIYNLTSRILNQELPATSVTGQTSTNYQVGGNPITYQTLMTNNTYNLGSFLAKGVSRHNLGIAVDLTLTDLNSGLEISMQSDIHDLSWYSVTGRNNDAANTLAAIMKEAGFGTLSSEWWHFQDDASKNALNLPAVSNGVSLEGWTRDNTGWMYRNQKGEYYKDQSLTYGDTTVCFDVNGYWITSDETNE